MARPGLAAVFAVAEFRAVWAADVLSVLGDQLARVALAVLVYAHTGSDAAVAAVYALTYLPAIVGGVALGWVADRFPRRTVMVLGDIVRAAAVAAMALPAAPLPVISALLVLVVLVGASHLAAQSASLPEILVGNSYDHGLAVRQITTQVGQLGGFALGGVTVAALGAGPALLVDAATFLSSAVILRIGLTHRPPPVRAERPGRSSTATSAVVSAVTSAASTLTAGIVTIIRDPQRRVLVGFAWIVGCFVVPEGLAVPYAAQFGHGPAVVGLLMAADPFGSVFGAWLLVRFVTASVRPRSIGVLAVAAGLPLIAAAATPPLALTVALWAASGACSTAYLLQTQAEFVRATPDTGRGAALGLAASGVLASQGLAILVGGLIADATTPAAAVAICGATGCVLALVLIAVRPRTR